VAPVLEGGEGRLVCCREAMKPVGRSGAKHFAAVCSKAARFKRRIRADVVAYRFGNRASDTSKPLTGQGSKLASGFQKDPSFFIQGGQGSMHVPLRNISKAFRYLIDRHRPRRPDMNPLVCQQIQTDAVEIPEFHSIFFRDHNNKSNDLGKRCQIQEDLPVNHQRRVRGISRDASGASVQTGQQVKPEGRCR
jgi:hypothetical protein